MLIPKDTRWYFRDLSAEFISCASRLAGKFTSALCHLLWLTIEIGIKGLVKSRLMTKWGMAWGATEKADVWLFLFLLVLFFFFCCVWRKVLFPKLILMVGYPLTPPGEVRKKKSAQFVSYYLAKWLNRYKSYLKYVQLTTTNKVCVVGLGVRYESLLKQVMWKCWQSVLEQRLQRAGAGGRGFGREVWWQPWWAIQAMHSQVWQACLQAWAYIVLWFVTILSSASMPCMPLAGMLQLGQHDWSREPVLKTWKIMDCNWWILWVLSKLQWVSVLFT